MLIKPFDRLVKEHKNHEDLIYLGIVVDNIDDKKLGRVRVRIPLYEDLMDHQLPYASPNLPYFLGNSKNSIMFSVPEIGSEVNVSFPTQDKYSPFYHGAELNENNKCTLFDEDYPNSYGFKDSKGNFTKINKHTDTWVFQHSSGINIIMSNNVLAGNLPNGSYFELDTVGSLGGACRLHNQDGSSIEMPGDNTIKLTSLHEVIIDSPRLKVLQNMEVGNGVTASIPSTNGGVYHFSKGILMNEDI